MPYPRGKGKKTGDNEKMNQMTGKNKIQNNEIESSISHYVDKHFKEITNQFKVKEYIWRN